MFTNGGDLLNAILFDIRTPIFMLKGAAEEIERYQHAAQTDTLTWFRKWKLVIDDWVSEEARLRSFCREPQAVEPSWEELIVELGNALSQASVVYLEAQTLALPDESEIKTLVEMAVRAARNIEQMHLEIANQDYKSLWAGQH